MSSAKNFKQSQKFRVIVGDASFYATAKQIRYGVGGLQRCNDAVQKALYALEVIRAGKGIAESCSTGLCANLEGLNVQIDMI